MGKIIIVEGPDGAGKSRLVNRLQAALKAPTHHFGPPTAGEDLLHTYARALYIASEAQHPVIYDRLYLGERVYGPIFRGVDRLGDNGYRIMRRLVSGYAALEILCYPPHHVALENWRKSRKHPQETGMADEKYRRVYNQYGALPSHIVYDYTQGDEDGLVEAVRACDLEPLPCRAIGSRNPRFLLVGERANWDDLDAPFVANGNSSLYLNECLVEAGFIEAEIALVNVVSLSGEAQDIRNAWEYLKKPWIIALGSHAEKAVTFAGLSSKVPHPAYWKRFHSGERDEYVRRLRQIRKDVMEGRLAPV